MVKKTSMKGTCEKLILFKKVPYWVYWPFIGLFVYILSVLFDLNRHFWTQLLFCLGLGLVPTFNIALQRNFDRIFNPLEDIFFSKNNEKFSLWLANRKEEIFTLKTIFSKIIVLSITILATFTVVYIWNPNGSISNQISVLIVFSIIAFFCGLCLYISIALLVTLWELSIKNNIKVIYLDFPNKSITSLQNYYSSISIMSAVFYIGLAAAIFLSPYGHHTSMIIWLSCLAFFPLLVFIWSTILIHLILANIKDYFLNSLNKEIEFTKELVFNNHKLSDIAKFEKLFSIHSYISKLKEWPFSLISLLTLVGTAGTAGVALIQLITAILNENK